MKAIVGGGFWLVVLVFGAFIAQRLSPQARYSLARSQTECWRAIMTPSPEVEIAFPGHVPLRLGNGVFYLDGPRMVRAGEVTALRVEDDRLVATVLLDARDKLRITDATTAICRTQGRSFLFAVRTLLPEERQAQIQQEWDLFLSRHSTAIQTMLVPELPGLLEGASKVIHSELVRILREREPEVQGLLSRFGSEIASQRIAPLFVDEIWPIIVEYGSGPANTIGRELWQRAPLFDLAWRAAYDRVVEDRPVHLEKRWNAYVRDEALPVIDEHKSDILAAVRAMLGAIAESEEVRSELKEIAEAIALDPVLQEFTFGVFQEVLIDNVALRTFLEEQLKSPRMQQKLREVNDRLQGFFDRIGNLIFLDETRDGINPDLARLLRIFLLRRDQQYIFLEWHPGQPLEEGQVLVGTQER